MNVSLYCFLLLYLNSNNKFINKNINNISINKYLLYNKEENI